MNQTKPKPNINATTSHLIEWLTCLLLHECLRQYQARSHTLFNIIPLSVDAVLCLMTRTHIRQFTLVHVKNCHSTISWIMFSYFPMTGLTATVCAYTGDNIHNCALPDRGGQLLRNSNIYPNFTSLSHLQVNILKINWFTTLKWYNSAVKFLRWTTFSGKVASWQTKIFSMFRKKCKYNYN